MRSDILPKVKLPVILIGHDVRNGDVQVWNGTEWSADVATAAPLENDTQLAAAHTAAHKATAANQLIDAEYVEIILAPSGYQAKNYRERVKLNGPSVRLDLCRNPSPQAFNF
jgi:Protein of unknown function (DUF2849)